MDDLSHVVRPGLNSSWRSTRVISSRLTSTRNETLTLPVHCDQLQQVPPFTRTTLGLYGTVTISTLLQLVSPYSYAFIPHKVAKNWEVYRLVLPFFFGGSGIAVIFNAIMLYRSLKDLELSHFRGKLANMTWAFILMGAGIIGINTPLETPILFTPFLMAIVHLWGQTNPSGRVSLYGLLQIPAPYFSLALLGMDLLNGGVGAMVVSLTGMASAQLYYYASELYPRSHPSRAHLVTSWLAPPQFLIDWLGNGAGVAPSASGPGAPTSSTGSSTSTGTGGAYSTGFGTGYRPSTGNTRTTSAGAGATATEDRQASHRWGKGNRLGS
ncbi:uncharacterized protein JCM15063_002040 [Sporobolomyces koalae]|uniref:uncharacterized protein n=1 Tax=Sporobolomyces koalae TaxID=500713 RepID=UPI003178556F